MCLEIGENGVVVPPVAEGRDGPLIVTLVQQGKEKDNSHGNA